MLFPHCKYVDCWSCVKLNVIVIHCCKMYLNFEIKDMDCPTVLSNDPGPTDGHEDRTSVWWFCVTEKCWSAAFR